MLIGRVWSDGSKDRLGLYLTLKNGQAFATECRGWDQHRVGNGGRTQQSKGWGWDRD